MSKYKITLGDISRYKIVFKDGESTGWIDVKTEDIRIERNDNMIKQEFDKLYLKNKTAVQCKTKELAIEFLALADKFGYKWLSSGRLTDPNTCHLYGEDTVYYPSDFGWQYGSIKNAHTQGYELVEYKREQPKSLYEQVLELVGLKIGDRFLINCSEFEVNSDNIYFVLNNKRSKTSYGDALISLLHNKDLLVKIKPNPKSEAELILDELEKVVDKAKAVLERSVR